MQSKVIGISRPKNGHELEDNLRKHIKCEVADSHAFLAAKGLEQNKPGFSWKFKLSSKTKGWALFERI